ncbi:MAG: SRPBCC family protein [Thermoleophilia bacterium]|nr:SRPBCC family protein [Thermoleophilia bacterium]
MRIDTDFSITRPPAETYELLLQLEDVTPCFPGAELGAERPDGSREVRVTVRLGPMKLAYDGDVRIAERDDAALRAVLAGNAREARGAGSASATITMRVEPDGTGSKVLAEAEVDLTGRAAQMGKGIVEDVARRLVGDMASCLETRFAQASGAAVPANGARPAPASPPPAAAQPLDGGRLLAGMVKDRLRDPRVAAAAAAGGLLLLRMLGRLLRRR